MESSQRLHFSRRAGCSYLINKSAINDLFIKTTKRKK